jgi:adenylylsulfate kinase
MKQNIFWHNTKIGRQDRTKLFGIDNKVIWFTGLSGSGKSTLAVELAHRLHNKGIPTYHLDGDNIRHGLCSDLGFSKEDREENIRRVGELAKLFYDAGLFTLVSFISPYRKDRKRARSLIGKDFIEVYVKAPLEVCEERDTKGLYKKAKQGIIKDFTGISAPYEPPENPEIIINTAKQDIDSSLAIIMDFLEQKL